MGRNENKEDIITLREKLEVESKETVEATSRDSVEATEGNVEARVDNNSHQANHSPPAEEAEKSTIADIFIKIMHG